MQKFSKAIAAIMLMTTVVWTIGCKSKNVSNGRRDAHEYVDLGLPSGTLWATCNLGAIKPEEYGYYFAWGEITPKTPYDWNTYWSHYKYGNGYFEMTKYCNNPLFGYEGFCDDLYVLLPEDDAAKANLGDGWCIPTIDQWKELRDNTISKWVILDGMKGRLFTAKNGNSIFLPATNGNSIFLPASSGHSNDGSTGCYWSSSLHTEFPHSAKSFGFGSEGCSIRYDYRPNGLPVRPVCSMR